MSTATLPVIDVGDLDRAATRAAVHDACCDWGFFQAVGHGIDGAVIAALRREMRAFFSQPTAAKHAIQRSAENPWGFYDRELTRRTRDWKEIYDYGPPDGGTMVPQWPAELPGFRQAIEAFYESCNALSVRLLRTISINLGMPAKFLDPYFRPAHTSFLRLNHYPKCPAPARPKDLSLSENGHLGVNHHTDAGAITLLLQDDQPGLEVFHDGAWTLVEPREDALVVNIGDIVQVWSNDRYHAALHRAIVSAERERYSAPFFFNPAYSVEYAPLPSTTDTAHPPRYRPIPWAEFRALRTAGDYADHGEYLQISHYRR